MSYFRCKFAITHALVSKIKDKAGPSFGNKASFLKKIDALPKAAKWTCNIVQVTGDRLDEDSNPMTEGLELWLRDPVECIKELLQNPGFRDSLKYAPER